jgi:ankyrin repeat protein
MGELDDTLTATYRKDLATLRQLTPAQVNARDVDGRTPLMHAVLASDADPAIVALLLERGADANAADHGQKWTALHFAARDQKASIVKTLLAAGADVDPVDAAGGTPLWHSVSTAGSNLRVIRELIGRGADPWRRNEHGISPMDLARTAERDDIASLATGDDEHLPM